jgi:hypothetical protein
MTKLDRIQASIAELSASEVAELHAWIAEFEARQFDDWLARDLSADTPARRALDMLAESALAEHRRGETRKI